MTTPLVDATKQNGVVLLELRNPPAHSYDLMRELDAHMDESVHVLMLTGRAAPPEANARGVAWS
jgi:DNA-binding response OmpR family regulator